MDAGGRCRQGLVLFPRFITGLLPPRGAGIGNRGAHRRRCRPSQSGVHGTRRLRRSDLSEPAVAGHVPHDVLACERLGTRHGCSPADGRLLRRGRFGRFILDGFQRPLGAVVHPGAGDDVAGELPPEPTPTHPATGVAEDPGERQ